MSRIITGLAGALLAVTRCLVPFARRDWADAMRAESAYLPEPARLRWAFGCLVAAIKLRLTPMQTGSLRVNRWIIVVESLVCFTPSILAWWFFTFGQLEVLVHDFSSYERHFMGSPDGKWVVGMMYGFAVCGLIGPIGLFLGLRYALLRRGLRSRVLGLFLVATSIAWSLVGTLSSFWLPKAELSVRWQIFILFTILPVAGILHLMYLARPVAEPPADARLAAG